MITKHASSRYRLSGAGWVLLCLCAAVFLTGATGEPASNPQMKSQPPDAFPYAIEIETYQESWSHFRPGDSVEILEVRGTAPEFKIGGSYQVKGRYTLASEKQAMLALYSTNGEVGPGTNELVQSGTAEFTRKFTIVKRGRLHVDFYPYPSGEGFGGRYFHKKGVPEPSYAALDRENSTVVQRAQRWLKKFFWPF